MLFLEQAYSRPYKCSVLSEKKQVPLLGNWHDHCFILRGRGQEATGSIMKKVVSLAEKREEIYFKRKESEFKSYLGKLKIGELRHEANYIIERMKEENLDDEFLLKGAMLMEELANRVNEKSMSDQISTFAYNLKSKVDEPPTLH